MQSAGVHGAPVPRTRRGSPPSLLLTLFGDYWGYGEEPLPSAALVELLADFGVNDAAARAALSRMVKHGLLLSSKSGRNTYYRTTDRARVVLSSALDRIHQFGSEPSWTGQWSVVTFGVLESNRSLRDAARARLRWLGFAPLYDGVWVSPRDTARAAMDQLAAIGLSATALRAELAPMALPMRRPEEAWDLADIREQYATFIAEVDRVRAELDEGLLLPAAALVGRTRLVDSWLKLSSLDPDLPTELLPANWPRARARARFVETYDSLGDRAVLRVQQAIAQTSPALASQVSSRRLAEATPVA